MMQVYCNWAISAALLVAVQLQYYYNFSAVSSQIGNAEDYYDFIAIIIVEAFEHFCAFLEPVLVDHFPAVPTSCSNH